MTRVPQVRCSAKNRKGEPCKAWAIKGASVCRSHGANKQVRANAAIRAEVHNWSVTDIADDPGETLLKLVTQSRRRAELYAQELEALVEQSPSLREALVADIWIQPEHGDAYKAGEYIRGLAKLEAEERDRCANFATKAIAAGLAERQVRMAERQGELLAIMVQAAIKEANLTPEQTKIVNASLGRQARELTV